MQNLVAIKDYQNEEKKYYQNNNGSTSTTSTTSTTSSTSTSSSDDWDFENKFHTRWEMQSAEERAATLDDALESCRDKLGWPTTRYLRMTLAKYIEEVGYQGMVYILEETARAPRPSLRYADAILRRLMLEGVKFDF